MAASGGPQEDAVFWNPTKLRQSTSRSLDVPGKLNSVGVLLALPCACPGRIRHIGGDYPSATSGPWQPASGYSRRQPFPQVIPTCYPQRYPQAYPLVRTCFRTWVRQSPVPRSLLDQWLQLQHPCASLDHGRKETNATMPKRRRSGQESTAFVEVFGAIKLLAPLSAPFHVKHNHSTIEGTSRNSSNRPDTRSRHRLGVPSIRFRCDLIHKVIHSDIHCHVLPCGRKITVV